MKLNTNNLVSLCFGAVMVLILLSGSVVFTFTDYMSDSLYGKKRVFFVILLMSYAIYRSIRIYHTLKRSKNET